MHIDATLYLIAVDVHVRASVCVCVICTSETATRHVYGILQAAGRQEAHVAASAVRTRPQKRPQGPSNQVVERKRKADASLDALAAQAPHASSGQWPYIKPLAVHCVVATFVSQVSLQLRRLAS